MSIFLRKRFFIIYFIVVGFDTVTEISEKSCNFFYDYYMMGKDFLFYLLDYSLKGL